MIYTYQCTRCGNGFERDVPMKDRLKPCEEACSECSHHNTVEQVIAGAPSTVSGVRRTNTQSFNDLLKDMSKRVGKENTIKDAIN